MKTKIFLSWLVIMLSFALIVITSACHVIIDPYDECECYYYDCYNDPYDDCSSCHYDYYYYKSEANGDPDLTGSFQDSLSNFNAPRLESLK